MESVRIQELIDLGWSLVGQLHQWVSTWQQQHQRREDLVELIDSLQLFWVRTDDLNLKRMARNSLVLEQFFERLCAKRLTVTPDHLKDVAIVIGNLEGLLLGFEATGDEPAFSSLESLQRMEHQIEKGFSSETSSRILEVTISENNGARSLTRTSAAVITVVDSSEVPNLVHKPNSTALTEVPRPSNMGSSSPPLRIEQLRVPQIQQSSIKWGDVPEASVYLPVQVDDTNDEVSASNSILILEESLFYRRLIDMALRSAGYETEVVEQVEVESFTASLKSPMTYGVVLVTPSTSNKAAELIRQSNEAGLTKVIGLRGIDSDEQFGVELDAWVTKSKPQELISVLGQLLNPESSEHPRKIA